jgi:LPS O-antigen subunit length determinant protein (WzzB/FepE family)
MSKEDDMEINPLSGANEEKKASSVQNMRDPDEINLLEYIYALVHRKGWIIAITLAGIVVGYIAAVIKGPSFVAEAVITPKEAESQKTPGIAGLGALGGLMAAQMNISGNASLDKIDLILGSRQFNAGLIERYNLLPEIYKYKWAGKYKKYWDPEQNNWRKEFIYPKPLDMGGFIKSNFLKKTMEKNKTMTIKVSSRDSAFTWLLAKGYVDYLDEYIKTDVQTDAKENVSYLEKQLFTVSDPLLREKIQSLIANEIEKEMVVSKKAFKIADPAYLYKSYREKRSYPLLFGFGLFFLTCMIVVFIHAFSSSKKSEDDRKYLEKIRREIRLFHK